MAYSITNNRGALSLTVLNEEEQFLDAQLMHFPMPASSADNALVFDMFGATSTFTVRGTFTGTKTECREFIYHASNPCLQALITGSQSSATYHSDTTNSNYTVKIQSVRWRYLEGNPNTVSWEIALIQGSGE
ncbi:hypothetical protein KY346_00715 [Candidatus Woesearchaeota archaeon]|nr:hypothetical protein [Candidatus Woesearchaeota archaeon]